MYVKNKTLCCCLSPALFPFPIRDQNTRWVIMHSACTCRNVKIFLLELINVRKSSNTSSKMTGIPPSHTRNDRYSCTLKKHACEFKKLIPPQEHACPILETCSPWNVASSLRSPIFASERYPEASCARSGLGFPLRRLLLCFIYFHPWLAFIRVEWCR